MIVLSAENTLPYLRKHKRIPARGSARAELLDWGVSNVVLRVECEDGHELVVKQSCEKLRTEVEWRSRLERIYREAEVQTVVADLLPDGMVPKVLFEDRANFLYGMEAVEADHRVWKGVLLDGETDEQIAIDAAQALATVHTRTAGDAGFRSQWNDVTVFEELRLDPFYRFLAGVHPQLSGPCNDLIAEVLSNRVCLVLGDFSPKNILLTRRGISLVDFETGHFGDPAFDLGFFLSHLLLKTILHSPSRQRFLQLAEVFWRTYLSDVSSCVSEEMHHDALSRRTTKHIAACLLARIDGKSPVDYLSQPQQETARRFALRLFDSMPQRPEEVFRRLLRTLD